MKLRKPLRHRYIVEMIGSVKFRIRLIMHALFAKEVGKGNFVTISEDMVKRVLRNRKYK